VIDDVSPASPTSITRVQSHAPAAVSAVAAVSRTRAQIVGQFFAVSWVALVLNMLPFLGSVDIAGPWVAVYVAAVVLTYAAIYLLPPLLLALCLNSLLSWRLLGGEKGRDPSGGWRTRTVYCVAVLGFAAVQMFVLADRHIHAIFGYHFNGFVLNVLTTPGGIESMGGDDVTMMTIAAMAAGFVLLEAGLLVLVLRAKWFRGAAVSLFRRRRVIAGIALAALLSVSERMAYAVAVEFDYTPVLSAANAFPFYRGLRIRALAPILGVRRRVRTPVRMKAGSTNLRYPLAPIRQGPHERWNVVWLACESLRADSLDPKVMPATWKFSQGAARFEQHLSAGNGTRMGMFGMFYGLYGPYWFPMLDSARGPVLLDLLRADGYEMSAFTSAAFTYPEFDQTIFSQFPKKERHARRTEFGWKSDRMNVTDLLAQIDRRDPARPFFTFMFFESPHAPYHFPPEAAIREPYLDSMNYATMDVGRDIELVRARYVNACRALDTELQRVFSHLEESGLLDRTIVIVTGDHGEEFMEKGRWGHNSTYAEEQIHTPLVIRVPGRAPQVVKRLTSHLDIPATLMTIFGVENPPADYSLGFDLFGSHERKDTVVAQWNDIAYVDADCKVVFQVRSYDYSQQVVTTRADGPVPDRDAVFAARSARFAELAKELGRFGR
jgi:membrane-anchored protein YejM (alkaline phosphatase superfamily)